MANGPGRKRRGAGGQHRDARLPKVPAISFVDHVHVATTTPRVSLISVVDTYAVQSVTQEAILCVWKVKGLCVGSIDFRWQPRTKWA
jgi:hypothetical protein